MVGEQPVIHPGHEFEYTSGTPLKTSSGLMHGSYQMEDFKGKSFRFLKNKNTRPLKDSVKENIFNMMDQNKVLDVEIKLG